jgi:hypothetical protein
LYKAISPGSISCERQPSRLEERFGTEGHHLAGSSKDNARLGTVMQGGSRSEQAIESGLLDEICKDSLYQSPSKSLSELQKLIHRSRTFVVVGMHVSAIPSPELGFFLEVRKQTHNAAHQANPHSFSVPPSHKIKRPCSLTSPRFW